MKSEHLELLSRLEACTLDDAAAAFPFSERLARDHHWPLPFAQRVIREYKRFAFLAVAAGHPVSPSHAVDEAWHLHLLYTQGYWKNFCGEVLRTPLHHQPTKGGASERGKFEVWYADTLASYRRFFDEEPPRDIWPKQNEHPVPVRFDPETHWRLPKPGFVARRWKNSGLGGSISSTVARLLRGTRAFLRLCLRRPAVPLWLMMLVLFASGCGPAVTALASPFDFRGPEFLGFYFAGLGIMVALAALLRWQLRQPAHTVEANPDLEPYAVTYLAGGRGLTVSAALASLYRRGTISVCGRSGHLAATKPLPTDAPPFERDLYELIAQGADTIKVVRSHAAGLVQPVAVQLKAQGLVVSDAQARKAVLIPLLLAAVVPATGFLKILIGIERDRPVGFLVAACILSLIGILVGFARRPLRSRRGDAVLAALRNGNQELRTTVQSSFAGVSSAALPMAMGLFGMTVLAGTPLDNLRTKLQPTATGSSCGSGCGGSGCGGGGGGCGGGCGGCGG